MRTGSSSSRSKLAVELLRLATCTCPTCTRALARTPRVPDSGSHVHLSCQSCGSAALAGFPQNFGCPDCAHTCARVDARGTHTPFQVVGAATAGYTRRSEPRIRVWQRTGACASARGQLQTGPAQRKRRLPLQHRVHLSSGAGTNPSLLLAPYPVSSCRAESYMRCCGV